MQRVFPTPTLLCSFPLEGLPKVGWVQDGTSVEYGLDYILVVCGSLSVRNYGFLVYVSFKIPVLEGCYKMGMNQRYSKILQHPGDSTWGGKGNIIPATGEQGGEWQEETKMGNGAFPATAQVLYTPVAAATAVAAAVAAQPQATAAEEMGLPHTSYNNTVAPAPQGLPV